jgi:chitinase
VEEFGAYTEFNSLKSQDVKTLIAVGGWTFAQSLFSEVSRTPEARATFASSCVEFMNTHSFDGLDIDWEYPVTRQGKPEDFDNLVLLVQALREAFGSSYLLTMAIPASVDKLSQGYDLANIAPSVDWLHIMSYDVYGAWDENAGSNTDIVYIRETVDYLLSHVPSDKLVLGMASYGRSVALQDSTCTTAGCPINGGAITGCSGELGFIPYFELKESYIDTMQYESLLFNEVTGSMEMVVPNDNGGKVWISLDVEQSWRVKQEFANEKCLRGTMWWAIDMIKELPFVHYAPSTNILPNTATNTDSSLTPPVNAPGVDKNDAYCKGEDGLVPTENCEGFVFCAQGKMSGSVVACGPGLYFDVQMGICNWPSGTNLCGFEFCPDGYSGYVPFEECTKFYYCSAGKIDGDIDVCPSGTLFDEVSGICNWASNVVCNTKAPTPPPIAPATPGPTFGSVSQAVVPAPSPVNVVASTSAAVQPKTPNPTYGSVNTANMPENQAMKVNDADFEYMQQDTSAILRFDPSDDAYVQEAKPGENWNDDYIVIDQNLRFDGLIRFFVQGTEGRRVNYAKLKLYVSQASDFGGNFYACKTDWHEDIVTWDSAPSILNNKPLAVINSVSVDDWIEVDLTEIVAGDGPVAVRIISDSTDNVMYSSKENPNRNAPQLIIGVEPKQMQENSKAINTLKIGPTDDAFVFKTASNRNYGRHEELKVDLDNGLKTTYLRFDFSRVNVNAIQSATLRLFVTDSSPSGGSLIKTSDTEWNENSITFRNAPSADGIVISTLGEVFQNEWIEIDITDAITESGPLSICIMGTHEDKVTYSSKEGLHSPEITLSLEESTPIEGQRKVLLPSDDATIVLQKPDANFGSSDSLQTDLRDGMRSFVMKFDASDIPQGQVKSATLRLYATNESPAFGGTFVEVMDSNWNEQTVTWSKAPSADGKVLGSLHEVEGGSWYDMDVTNAVLGGSAVSFRVSSPHSSTAEYGSKESSHKPKLIVQYSPSDPTPEGFEVFDPTDDASILLEQSNGNFGRDSQLKIDGSSGVYHTLLRFDLTSVEKGSISEAILRLYAVDGSPSGGTFISTSDTEWSQYKVTWDSAPKADGIVLATLGEVQPYSWYEIDIKEIAQGGEAISIRIAPSHGNRCAYSSLEDPYGRKPQLLIKSDIFKDVQ